VCKKNQKKQLLKLYFRRNTHLHLHTILLRINYRIHVIFSCVGKMHHLRPVAYFGLSVVHNLQNLYKNDPRYFQSEALKHSNLITPTRDKQIIFVTLSATISPYNVKKVTLVILRRNVNNALIFTYANIDDRIRG
jgi:hypothetical protein